MFDLTSTILVSVIIILTVILIIFSIQIFNILRDFRKSLKKIDLILTNFENLAKKIDQTVTSASLISLGAKIISSVVSLIRKNEPR